VNKGRSGRADWLVLFSLLFFAGAGFVYLAEFQGSSPNTSPNTGPSSQAVESADEDDGSKKGNARRKGPLLSIPAIGVRTPVVSLGKNPDGTLETPTNFDRAGLWTGGPSPGEHGPAIISGHVDSARSGPAVFYRLRDLEPGDIVRYTTRRGRGVRFEVERMERYPKDDFPTLRVYGRTDGPRLRLITCTGDFDTSSGHYRDNLVVYARRV
jgi:LPXTG-site transpeptidase (sortase) family protein